MTSESGIPLSHPPPVNPTLLNMTINFGVPLVPKTSEIDLSATSGPYGTHDTLRHGFFSASHALAPKHPLQTSLASLEEVEESRKMYIAKSTLGSHIPLRLNLEKDIAKSVNYRSFYGLI